MKRHEIRDLSVPKKSYFFGSKKASMQLSINAIVILVMAMAVLGIGLGLIRGVLAPAQDNLEDALGKVDLNEIATSTKPIANLPQTLRMKSSSENELVVSFYNTGHDQCDDNDARLAMVCGATTSQADACSDSGECIQINALPVNSEPGTATTLIANVEPDGFDVGSTPCKVVVLCGAAGAVPDFDGSDRNVVEEQAVFVNFGS